MAKLQKHRANSNIKSSKAANSSSTIDYRLVLELQKNARMSNSTLAGFLGISESAVRRHITKLVNSGDILLIAVPNLSIFGYPVQVWFEFNVKMHQIIKVANHLCSYSNITWLSLSLGVADIVAKAFFRSNEDLADFIDNKLGSIEDITNITTIVQLQVIKRTMGRLEDMPLLFNTTNDIGIYPKFDELDYMLLFKLQENARISIKNLAKMLYVSSSTINRRIKILVNSGSIALTAIAPLLNKERFDAINSQFGIEIGLQTNLVRLHTIAHLLASFPQIHTVSVVAGSVQILITIFDSSLERLQEFIINEIAGIEGVNGFSTLVFTKPLKASYDQLDPELARIKRTPKSGKINRRRGSY